MMIKYKKKIIREKVEPVLPAQLRKYHSTLLRATEAQNYISHCLSGFKQPTAAPSTSKSKSNNNARLTKRPASSISTSSLAANLLPLTVNINGSVGYFKRVRQDRQLGLDFEEWMPKPVQNFEKMIEKQIYRQNSRINLTKRSKQKDKINSLTCSRSKFGQPERPNSACSFGKRNNKGIRRLLSAQAFKPYIMLDDPKYKRASCSDINQLFSQGVQMNLASPVQKHSGTRRLEDIFRQREQGLKYFNNSAIGSMSQHQSVQDKDNSLRILECGEEDDSVLMKQSMAPTPLCSAQRDGFQIRFM